MANNNLVRITFEEALMQAVVTFLRKVWPKDESFSMKVATPSQASLIISRDNYAEGATYGLQVTTEEEGNGSNVTPATDTDAVRFSVLNSAPCFSGVLSGMPCFRLYEINIGLLGEGILEEIVDFLQENSCIAVSEQESNAHALNRWLSMHVF